MNRIVYTLTAEFHRYTCQTDCYCYAAERFYDDAHEQLKEYYLGTGESVTLTELYEENYLHA